MMSCDPTSPHKRERRKQARPGELLDAALELFVEKGFAATRVEEVAAHAGVSKGTLFLYFPSKEDLFKAVVQENIVRHQAQGAEEIARFEGSSALMLECLMLEWWRRHGATKAAGISKLVLSEASNFPDLAHFFQQKVVEPNRALVAAVLQRGIDRGEFRVQNMDLTVHAVMAPLLYLVTWKHPLACARFATPIDPEAFIRHHAALLVRGLSV